MIAMIDIANNRSTKRPGDPKVGGHPAACASCFHLLGALHLAVRQPQDFVACKPHASPVDHAYHHLMRLFRRQDGTYLTDEEGKGAMHRLRKFSVPGESDVFQSYHAKSDPDSFHFLPSGTVGIPPVNSIFLALAYRYAESHGHEVPANAHFWSLMGDSEFREGSLYEALPEASERQLGNVTWIVDYNRQSLDGTRNSNEGDGRFKDCDRIERTVLANGWKALQLRHGRYREELFERNGGEALRDVLERRLSDYEYQFLLFKEDAQLTRENLGRLDSAAGRLVGDLDDAEVQRMLADLGGHDMGLIIEALELSRTDPEVPYFIVAHTLKGYGLECAADPANHSTLPSKKEVTSILESRGLSFEQPFELFDEGTDEAAYLAQRQEQFRAGLESHLELKARNAQAAAMSIDDAGGVPEALDIDLSMFPLVHTQQMWGQLAAKLMRTGTHGLGGTPIGGAAAAEKPLEGDEARWKQAAKWMVTLSPDVGTSTQIAPTMNSRVYGPGAEEGEAPLPEFHARHPELATTEQSYAHHLRFEIVEQNVMSAMGSFGVMAEYTGLPFIPVMTVYDFFLKRALDQLYYDLYWGSEFILLGTPSGVTLSPEGAQHSWKSDIQMPNLITWEPFYGIEMDWILSDAIARQMEKRNTGRSGVLLRAVTRAVSQKDLLPTVRRQARFKPGLDGALGLKPASGGDEWGSATDESTVAPAPDETILAQLRLECLSGAYTLVDWRGYAGYEPGDNVVQILAMGSLVTEAVAAAETLLELGIYANVHVVTSPDLLLGILGDQDNYRQLTEGLGIDGHLHLTPGSSLSEAGLVGLAGRRVPIVAVCDGEAGLLDNAGSIVGTRQVTCAVRRFSKCGRPDEVYGYQSIDADAVVEAAGKVLSETALDDVRVSAEVLEQVAGRAGDHGRPHWRELWPTAGDRG